MIDERFASTLEEHGVTRRQWQLLAVLSRGAASVEQLDAAIAPFLAPDGETSAEHLGELIESGWVAVAGTASGPSASYEITERGHTAYIRLAEVVAANREIATDGVSPAEYDTLVSSLRRIAENLGWSEQ